MSLLYPPRIKTISEAGLFHFSCLSFLICKMRALDHIGLEVLLIPRIIDLGSSSFSTRFLFLTGIFLPIERHYNTR